MEHTTKWEPLTNNEGKIVGYWVTTSDDRGNVLSMTYHGPNKDPWRGWSILSHYSLRLVLFWEKLMGLCPRRSRIIGPILEIIYWILYDDIHKRFFNKAMGN